MINLNSFPLSISCVSPYKLKILFIFRKSDNFKYLIYFQFEIFSNVRAEILWYGDFLRHEGQVLRGIPVLCLVVLSATGLSSQECGTVLPEVLWGTKEHQGDTTLMKCRQPALYSAASGPTSLIIWNRLEFSSWSMECWKQFYFWLGKRHKIPKYDLESLERSSHHLDKGDMPDLKIRGRNN